MKNTDSKNMFCEYWFPVPIWQCLLNEITEKEIQQAVDYCRYIQSTSPGRIMTNVGGWQSNELYEKDLIDTPLNKYITLIKNLLPECIEDLDGQINLKITNLWININNKGDINTSHDHPRSTLSGVFYLTDNNSEIIFERPGDANNYFLDNVYTLGSNILSHKLAIYKPIKSMLLIFPSWLRHKVAPSLIDGERISIAFNTERVIK